MIERTEEEQAGLDLKQATTAVLREARRFYEVAGLAGTSSPFAKAWEFYLAAADVAGVALPEYQEAPDADR